MINNRKSKSLFVTVLMAMSLIFFAPSFAQSSYTRLDKDECLRSLKERVRAPHTFRVTDSYRDGQSYYVEFTTRILVVTHYWVGKCTFDDNGLLVKADLM